MHVGSMCCAAGAAVCAGHAGLALYASALWYEGYVVALQCCWALQCVGTADSSLSCPDLCQLTLTLPLPSLRTSMAKAENQIQSCIGSAFHSDVVSSLAFLGLFCATQTVRVAVAATCIENACHLNAATVCPSSPSQHFKVSFSYDCEHASAALLYFPYSHMRHVPKTELPWKIKCSKGPVAFGLFT